MDVWWERFKNQLGSQETALTPALILRCQIVGRDEDVAVSLFDALHVIKHSDTSC